MKSDTLAESLLHEIWKDQSRFLVPHPILSDGTEIKIISRGEYNDHRGGPDFMNAEIALDGMRIKGDIELHKRVGGWDDHGHSDDKNYSQVILHVVLDADIEELQNASPKVPVLILRDNLAFDQRTFWQELFEKKFARSPELPCFPHNLSLPMNFKSKVVAKMGEARLDERIARIVHEVGSPITDEFIHDKVYEFVFDAFGYSENRMPFIQLARLLPRSFLQKIRAKESAQDIHGIFEALFFGASGLLSKPQQEFEPDVNEYLLDLSAKWEALKVDYDISEHLAENDWAFFRVRPLNTPYRRIALAAVLARKYFSRTDYSIYEDITYELGDSPFWEKHISFKQSLDEPHALLGDERKRAIVLNVIFPARIVIETEHAKGKSHEQEKIQSRVKPLRKEWGEYSSRSSAQYINVVEQELLESENIRSTLGEQGALYLYRNFCTAKRCSECPVGERLMIKGWKPLR